VITERGSAQTASRGDSAAKATGLRIAAQPTGYPVTHLRQLLYARALGVSADTVRGLNGLAAGYSGIYPAVLAVAVSATRSQVGSGVARQAEASASPMLPRDASVLAVHVDVR